MESGAAIISQIESNYFTAAPIKLTINDFYPLSGTIDATVEIYSPLYSISDAQLRFLLLEDDVTGSDTQVTREIISETFSLSGQGSTYNSSQTFEIDPDYDTTNLRAVVFVQLADQQIIQSVSSYPVPDYRVRVVYESDQILVGPPDGTTDTDNFSVVNVGLNETFTTTLIVDDAPDGTLVTFCDEYDNCYPSQATTTLNTEEDMDYHANIMPSASGMISFHFEISSPNIEDPLILPFTYITDDTAVLLVDDDGGEEFENYFSDALTELDYSYAIWNLNAQKLTPELIDVFDVLVWNVGWEFPSLDELDREFLEQYLDSGGNIFLSGQDIGWDLNDSDSNMDVEFYNNYLHADYIADDANYYDLAGVNDDPVSNGIQLHIQGGDGANNQEYPSRITNFDNAAVEIFHYTNNNSAGAIRAIHPSSEARLVYFAFGYEAIDNAADRSITMYQILSWLMDSEENFVPVIDGVVDDFFIEANTSFTITLDDLIVTDIDDDYPNDFVLTVLAGENYTVSGNTVTLANDFIGDLIVYVSVNDGVSESEVYEIEVFAYLPGDLNVDEIVDILDIVRLLSIILATIEPTEYDLIIGDMNGDGLISVLDIIQVLNIILSDSLIKGRPLTDAGVEFGDGQVRLIADGKVAGVQMEVSGDFQISNHHLPEGWELHTNNSTILFFSNAGSAFDNSLIFDYCGELQINDVVVGDWLGNEVKATVHCQLPTDYSLNPAFPNPFNAATTISYSLPADGFVNVSIYDMNGKAIKQLVNGNQIAGVYQIIWNADEQSSGVYLVKMNAGEIIKSRKIILIK